MPIQDNYYMDTEEEIIYLRNIFLALNAFTSTLAVVNPEKQALLDAIQDYIDALTALDA
jgi:hypothetical protein